MNADAVLLANGSVRIKRTRHGLMAYNINDLFVGRSLDCYGEYSQGEIRLFAQLAAPGACVVDVGANIGALTLSLAQIVGPRGAVVAIEPQRAVYQLLCANLALNEIGNVRAIQAAAGTEAGQAFVPVTDHSKPGNFGGIELSSEGGERVDVLTVDSLQLPACQFIKIDVEGREQSVIAGATQTIARFRPALYVENDRRHQSADLIRQIREFGYTCYWHLRRFIVPTISIAIGPTSFQALSRSTCCASQAAIRARSKACGR
ncbi:MAG: FkbM family methyltransferase [Xanthobacteraceae bacterium]